MSIVRAALKRPTYDRQRLDGSVRMVLSRYDDPQLTSLTSSSSVGGAVASAHYGTDNPEKVVLVRFSKPINPTLDGSEIRIDLAGGALNVRRVASTDGNPSIIGDVSATIRYTLMSVDWDPWDEDIDWDNQPQPGEDDPTIEVDLEEVDKGFAWYNSQKIPNPQGASWYDPTGILTALAAEATSLKFEGCEDKLYYGVRVEIVSVDAGEKYVPTCGGFSPPTTISVSNFWGPVLYCHDVNVLCDMYPCAVGSTLPMSYVDPVTGCGVTGVATSTGACSVTCGDYYGYGYIAETWCEYSIAWGPVTPPSVGGTLDIASAGSVYIITPAARTELEVVSRSAAAGVATLTLAEEHGLPYGEIEGISLKAQAPNGVDGVDNGTPVSLATVASVGTAVTFTTATPHGLKVGQYVHIYGTAYDGLRLVGLVPNTTTFRISAPAITEAVKACRGVAVPAIYDRTMPSGVTVPGVKQIRYSLPSALATFNEAETDCGGVVYLA